jgi:hypothetical protein
MAAIDVLTNRYNPERTGANLHETVLNQANVNVNDFGKIFSRGVDGQIYAQPLIVSDLDLPSIGRRSLVFVATTRNHVYAFDTENPAACHPLWGPVNLDTPNGTPVPCGDYGGDYQDFTSEIGIVSTPVIDRGTETIYLTAKSKEIRLGKPHYFYRLHALDIRTGAARPHSPATIAETIVNDPEKKDGASNFTFVSGPTVKGHGSGSENGTITFNAFFQLQRPGLLLQDGTIFLAFASQGDKGTYHGWGLAYDAQSLEFAGAYCTTPNWGEGGIWQSGCGLAGDGKGNVFAVCGNGLDKQHPSEDQLKQGPFFGQSVLKLSHNRIARSFSLVSWFTPKDIVQNNDHDEDLCAGPVILPWNNLLGAWGKDRAYYIMDRDHLGGFTPGDNAIAQYAPGMTAAENPPTLPQDPANDPARTGHIHCAPVMFDDPELGPISYVWGENDQLRGYRFDVAKNAFETSPSAELLSERIVPVGMPGGMLTISCNGATKGTAIVWALHPAAGNANHQTVAGVLQAYRADDLRKPIWASNHDPRGTDDLGDLAKFCCPVVANGRVYVATFSQQLVVYGLLTEPQSGRIGDWQQADVPVQTNVDRTFSVEGTASFSCQRFTILGSGHDIWDPADAFHFVYQSTSDLEISITARVVSVQNTSPWAKAGVMLRASLDADSAHAMMVVTPGNGAAFQFRWAKGVNTVHVPYSGPAVAPFWVRVVRRPRNGTFEFVGFASRDGNAWTQVGTANIQTPGTILAGMAVTAHTDRPNPSDRTNPLLEDLCVAVIDKVTLEAPPGPV